MCGGMGGREGGREGTGSIDVPMAVDPIGMEPRF